MERVFALFLAIVLVLTMSITCDAQLTVKSKDPQIGHSQTSSQEVKSMQADVLRMRAILNQMRTNLGFVANTTTPVHHQFELEIDMWQVLLDQMDRRIAQLQANSGK